jgi:transposase
MSYKIRLSTEQSYQLADQMNQVSSKKLSRRLLAISLRHYGYPIHDIALLTGVSEKTVTAWIKAFLAGGFEQLLHLQYPKRRDSKLAPHEEAIRAYQAQHPQARIEDLQQWLATEHGLQVEYSWLYRYLERHDLWKNQSDAE